MVVPVVEGLWRALEGCVVPTRVPVPTPRTGQRLGFIYAGEGVHFQCLTSKDHLTHKDHLITPGGGGARAIALGSAD